MNIITKTALANFKKNKSRNILIGIAIMLTAMLLTVVPSVVFNSIDLRFAAINKVYPTFHGMFRNVDDRTAGKIEKDEALTDVGMREDPAQISCGDPKVNIVMVWADQTALDANRLKLKSGKLPEKADEIVVSEGLLKAAGLSGETGDRVLIPYQVLSSDGGLGIEQQKEFTITGFAADSEESLESGLYSAIVSRKFAQEIIPEGEHSYRIYFQLAHADRMTTDAIEDRMKEIGAAYHIREDNIVENAEYLNANYVDPAMLSGMAAIMIIVVLAGILTIYSIYYVSMMDKIQEYGKLKAIGSTKRQIRQLVFREGFAVAAIAVPIGIVLGILAEMAVMKKTLSIGIDLKDPMTMEMEKILRSGELSVIKPWILLLAAGISLLTIYISLLKPMQKAAKISAIEAIRFQGAEKKGGKKKDRKGYKQLNIRKLTLTNLGRNKKRSAITIVSLAVTGIFFMVVATVMSCVSARIMTADQICSDIEVHILSRQSDKMHPEWEVSSIQQNNPLTEELMRRILDIDGVTGVERYRSTDAMIQGFIEEDGEPMQVGLGGLDEKEMKELGRYVEEGSLDDKKLKEGTGVILTGGYIGAHAGKDWKPGDEIQLDIKDGSSMISKDLEIVAITDAPGGLTGDSFVMPADTLQGMLDTDVTYRFDITADKKKVAETEKQVKALIENQENLEMETWRNEYSTVQKSIGFMEYACYALMFILGLISILNFVNTMINSVYVRRRELGVLQAIGLSGRQMIRMLQLEGLFYTAGTLILSLGIGSIAGYGCFLKAKAEGIMSIRTYQYPVVPAVVLAVVILTVQLLITYLVNKSLNKQSMIDRIRFSD